MHRAMSSRAASDGGGGAADAAKRSMSSQKSARSATTTAPSTGPKKSSQGNGAVLPRKPSRSVYAPSLDPLLCQMFGIFSYNC